MGIKRRIPGLRALRPGDPRRNAPVPVETRLPAIVRAVRGIGAPVPTLDAPKGRKPVQHSGILEYWRMLRLRQTTVIAVAVVGGVIAFLTTLSEPRIYQAGTTVEIQGTNENFLNMQDLNPNKNTSYLPDYDIKTQIHIIMSRTLIDRVRARMSRPAEPLPQPDRLSAWRKALGISPPTDEELWQRALGTATQSIRAHNEPSTRIVQITCDSTSPVLAANFLNALTEEYTEESLEARWQANEHMGEWLTNQLRDLRVKLEKSEDELQSYAASFGIVITPEEKNNVSEAKLADLQKELFAAQADRVAKQSRWETAAAAPAEALPALLEEASLQGMERNLEELRRTRAQLRITYTSNAPQVRSVDAQIGELTASLDTERNAIMQRLKRDFESAQRREKLLQDSYEQQERLVSGETAGINRYNFLKREVDATRTLYESLLTKMKEASIASALRASNLRVVDKAIAPGGPYQPAVPRTTAAGVMFGLFLGCAYAVLRDHADRTLRDPGDSPYYLELPELGVLPVYGLEDALLRRPRRATTVTDGERAPVRMELTTWNSKKSLLAECIRAVQLSIIYSSPDPERHRVLVITSPSPKEGKTTMACNLAIAMAEVTPDVLLIDADIRRPRLHDVFGLSRKDGLSDLLAEQGPLTWERIERAVSHSSIQGLSVMTCGSVGHAVSILLHSGRLPELLSLLRTRYRAVLIDTPPMVNIGDARIVGRHADAVILVIRSGSTNREAALMAKDRLTEDGIHVLGTVLNAWNPNLPGYGYYRNYYSGYANYNRNNAANGHSAD